MFVPGWQREPDDARLWAVVERESFAQLICCDDHGAPSCTLMPFIRRDGRLWTHFAAANPQIGLVAGGRPVLCQFLGPGAYVSPAWYSQPGDVPTWNFVQVAVTGRLAPVDRERTHWILKETVREHEGHRESPLPFARMEDQVTELIDGIRAFEVLVDTIEGRFKLSQNRSTEDRRAIIDALSEGTETERQVAALMTEELTRSRAT